MKHTIRILVFLMLSFSIAFSQSNKEFELKGQIEGLKDGTRIYLCSKSKNVISVTNSKGSKFILNGYVQGEANYYFLWLDSISKKPNANNRSQALWLINSPLSISGNVNDIANLKLTGSEPHDIWLAFKALQDKNRRSSEWTSLKSDFIEDHLDSSFIPYLLIKTSPEEQKKFYSKLSDNLKNTYYAKEIAQQIQKHESNQEMHDLGIIPSFMITSHNGKQVSIHEIASKSKYTLIDFWASWCSPCRSTIPKLKMVYDAFHSKGFNIVGISTDKNEIAWKKALTEDKAPWLQGLDNIENASKNIFGLVAIPGYLLIDQKGNVVQSQLITSTGINPNNDGQTRRFKGKNLGADLHEILEELFGEEDGK